MEVAHGVERFFPLLGGGEVFDVVGEFGLEFFGLLLASLGFGGHGVSFCAFVRTCITVSHGHAPPLHIFHQVHQTTD